MNKKVTIIFILPYLIGTIAGLLILLGVRLSFWTSLFSLIISLAIVLLFIRFTKKPAAPTAKKGVAQKANLGTLWYILWTFLYLLIVYFFLRARTGIYINSPWQVVHPVVFPLCFLLLFLTGLIIFQETSIKKRLFLIILVVFLFSLGYVLVYEMGYGGDKWKHMAQVYFLMDGNIISPTARTAFLSFTNFKNFLNNLFYSGYWGITISLAYLTRVDIFWIDLMFFYLWWSIFLPLLFYNLGRLFFKRARSALLATFSLVLLAQFWPLGASPLPKGWGLLLFLFSLLAFSRSIYFWKQGKKNYFFLLPFILLIFNYALYALIFLEILLIWSCLRIKKPVLKKPLLIFLILIFIALPPLADGLIVSSWEFHGPKFIGQKLGNFLVSLLVSRPIFVTEGNYFFYASKGEPLTNDIMTNITPWRLWSVPLVWIFICLGIFWRKEKRLAFSVLKIFLLIFLTSQFLSASFLKGPQIFSRRLTLPAGLVLIFFFVRGLGKFKEARFFSQKAKIIFISLFIGLLAASAYASGPASDVVTKNRYLAAKYIWQNLEKKPSPYCVLGREWPLLALEAVSHKNIVEGGFSPRDYSQREELFKNMCRKPSPRYMEEAIHLTGASSCWFETEFQWLGVKELDEISQVFGENPEIFGSVLVWYYTTTNYERNTKLRN